jgi:sarcosine oxidase subunit beta
MSAPDAADLVVVGAGTLGGWASVFARTAGVERVVVLERGLVGQGASSRAAGVVRAQGGTPIAVRLGRWSVEFYRTQAETLGVDSGFRQLGYILLATSGREERAGRERVAMQRSLGLDVRWLVADEAVGVNPTLSPNGHRGGSFLATDGCIDPPRNVLAYSLAMQRAGVELRERTPFLGLRLRATGRGRRRVTGVETPDGVIRTERVLLTGGPSLRAVGKLAGVPIPAGAVRHQVAVTQPHPSFERGTFPMVFDVAVGLYWRQEEGGLLFGMSNPDEPPGWARSVDWRYLRRMRQRLARLVPATSDLDLVRAWAATIDYTPDHLPIVGPAIMRSGDVLEGATVLSAGGHGMMWGPALARIGADLALQDRTDVADVTSLGLDRFDEQGNSRLPADPIALPFPTRATEEEEADVEVTT